MKSKVAIPTRRSRAFIRRSVPYMDASGEVQEDVYNEIGGILLIPVSDAHKFGENRSNLTRYFNEGKLIPYLKNGKPKRNTSNRPVFFDLHEWKEADL